MSNESDVLLCDFCEKSQDNVGHMIAGPDVNICSGCVYLCTDILVDRQKEELEELKQENKALLKQLEGESNE